MLTPYKTASGMLWAVSGVTGGPVGGNRVTATVPVVQTVSKITGPAWSIIMVWVALPSAKRRPSKRAVAGCTGSTVVAMPVICSPPVGVRQTFGRCV